MPTNLDVRVAQSRSLPQTGRDAPLKRVLDVLRLDPAGKFGSLEEQALTLARAFRDRGSLFLPVFQRPLDPDSATQYAREGLSVEALDLSQFRFGTLRRLLQLVRRKRLD